LTRGDTIHSCKASSGGARSNEPGSSPAIQTLTSFQLRITGIRSWKRDIQSLAGPTMIVVESIFASLSGSRHFSHSPAKASGRLSGDEK
jgi:hypothetical protein